MMISMIEKRCKMSLKYFFMILLLLVTIAIIREKNNFKLIIFFSGFSLIAASLYFYNHAPDVALAEIAVGSAFIPLIFLITISKQRTFTVMDNTDRKFIHFDVIDEFCKEENFKLKIIDGSKVVNDEAKGIHGVFRHHDVDLIIDYNQKKKRYDVTGKTMNLTINRFEEMTAEIHSIRVIRISDEETID